MKSFQRFFITLTCMLFIFSAKSQWIPCQGIEGADCRSIATQDSYLFIVGHGGIYRRQIDDPTWGNACLVGGFTQIRSTSNALFSWGPMVSLCRSLDLGLTWEEIDMGYEYQNIETLDNILFVDIHWNYLLKSSDNGESYSEIDPSAVSNDIEWIYSQPGILFCFLENIDTLYRSDDYGMSWITYPLNEIEGIGPPYLFNDQLWMASGNRFYIYENDLDQWIIQQDTLPGQAIIVDFIEDSETLCCYSNIGYFHYNVQNSQWEAENLGLESGYCKDACRQGNTIFLATSLGPFSKAGNEPWIPQYDDLFGFAVTQIFIQGSRTYALAKGGIYYSDVIENGFDPYESQGYCSAHKLLTHSSGWYTGSDCGFSISDDSGYTWTDYSNGLENLRVWNIARTNLYYYAMVYSVDDGLFRSKTYLNEWERVPNDLGMMYLSDIDILDNIIFAVGNGMLYRSDDFGNTFETILGAGSGSYLYIKNNKVFFFSNTEIKYSTDVGITWQTWISGITGAIELYCMAISESEDTSFVGGFVGPWHPKPFLKMFTPQYPEGVEILDNLQLFDWHSITQILIDNGRLFICPSSGGLWYRDDLAVGISDKEPLNNASYSQLSIYPNPAKDIIRIHHDWNIKNAEYQVIDYSGKLIMKGKIEMGMDDFSLDVSNLSGGIYLIIFRDNDQIISGKFIKAD